MTDSLEIASRLALLREPFPENQVSKLPKPMAKREIMDTLPKALCPICNNYHATTKIMHLDYVGHAALTDRLLDVDPLWSWEPLAMDDRGLPLVDGTGGMWIKLTICGITRLGYGDADGKTGGNAVKERIGDALRNAAMRFGAALDLWHKGELHVAESENDPPEESSQNESRGTINGWDLKAQEDFVVLSVRLYAAFKEADKLAKYLADADHWKDRRWAEPSEVVLKAMEAWAIKLEDAAKAAAYAKPAPLPPGIEVFERGPA